MTYRLNRFYVYAYCDIRKPGIYTYGEFSFDFEPFYVGKGFGKRDIQHLYYAKDTSVNNHKVNKIRRIISQTKLNPLIVRLREGLFEQEAFDLEERLIKLIGRHPNGPLTNMTDGQEGTSGYRLTDEQRVTRSVKNPFKGRHHTLESLRLMSKAHSENQLGINNPFYGKRHTQDTIAKIVATCREKSLGSKNAFYGKHHKQVTKDKLSSLRKKTYTLTDPDGSIHIVHGMDEAKRLFGLHVATLRYYFNRGKIPPPSKRTDQSMERINTTGWSIVK